MKYLYLAMLILVACSVHKQTVKEQTDEEVTKAKWKSSDYINEVQILLTNMYEFENAFSYGASSFLIYSKSDTFLCTAKHLLSSAMGIEPEIKTTAFNDQIHYWKAYPRNDLVSKDTITCTSIVNEEINKIDIILLNCINHIDSFIQGLEPRFTPIAIGEKLEVIGCEYSDINCHQKIYEATMDEYFFGSILVKSSSSFNASGFSGAPVIDSKGYVVGVLTGGFEDGGVEYLVIEPITKIKDHLLK